MKPEHIDQVLNNSTMLVESNNKLVDNNSKLVDNNCEVITMLKEGTMKAEGLTNVSYQIYMSLAKKTKKSALEISWYEGLKKVFEIK
ncbi:MAG: hypothetical protein JKX68_02630 [Flavobacteriales bacterium]|nr:hypothetical protein [Flavobacteriales bacterium]